MSVRKSEVLCHFTPVDTVGTDMVRDPSFLPCTGSMGEVGVTTPTESGVGAQGWTGRAGSPLPSIRLRGSSDSNPSLVLSPGPPSPLTVTGEDPSFDPMSIFMKTSRG